MNNLILVRGVVGAGKSTIANILSPNANIAADDYFDKFNNGVFDASKLQVAHEWCKTVVMAMMHAGNDPTIAVHNTFTQEWEMKPYFNLAKDYGYRVSTIIVENRHESQSVHNVPDEVKQKMIKRFEVVL
jgi:predicted kinase